jgi:hypothetical protein
MNFANFVSRYDLPMVNKRVDLTPVQIEHLKSLVTGLVSTNETVLDQHGRDESAIPPVRPSAVVMPQNTEEVSNEAIASLVVSSKSTWQNSPHE